MEYLSQTMVASFRYKFTVYYNCIGIVYHYHLSSFDKIISLRENGEGRGGGEGGGGGGEDKEKTNTLTLLYRFSAHVQHARLMCVHIGLRVRCCYMDMQKI